jgi:hypothetical protein
MVLWLLHYHDGAVRVVGAVVAHAPKDGPARIHHFFNAEVLICLSQILKQTEFTVEIKAR